MDVISYSKAAQQETRVKKIIAEPDSTSGLVTMPSTIATGETITIPAGRVVVHPNLQVDGTLDIQGDLFIPSGGTISDMVSLSEDQTIAGIKTFSSSPIVPTPTTSTQVASKGYADGLFVSASETVAGKVELATNAEVQTGTDTTKAVTPAGFRGASLGQGQTWQDVTASRVAGTTYTNSTGKPIFVVVHSNPTASIELTVDGIITYKCAFVDGYNQGGGAIVPNNGTYKATFTGGGAVNWSELR